MTKRKSKKTPPAPFTLNVTTQDIIQASEAQHDNLSAALLGALGAGDAMGGFAAMLALESLIHLEEEILKFELHELNEGYPVMKDPTVLPRSRQRYTKLRAQLEQQLGADFGAQYATARAGHNECARANLDSTNGGIYTVVLPLFNQDGTHDPLGPKDFAWSVYKKGV